jgi:hypothetical protein
LESVSCPVRAGIGSETHYEYFEDQKMVAYNKASSTTSYVNGSFYVPDTNSGGNSWKKPDDNTDKYDAVAVAAKTINPGETGDMILLKKTYYGHVGTVGTLYKFDSTGNLTTTTDRSAAIFKQITDQLIEMI